MLLCVRPRDADRAVLLPVFVPVREKLFEAEELNVVHKKNLDYCDGVYCDNKSFENKL